MVTTQSGALLSVNTTRATPTLSDAVTLTVCGPGATCPPLGGCRLVSTGDVVSPGFEVGVGVGGPGVLVAPGRGVFVGVGVGTGLVPLVETEIAEDREDSFPAMS